MTDDPVFRELRRVLESSPLPKAQMEALCAKWLREGRATLRRVKLRQLAREIATPSNVGRAEGHGRGA